MSEDEQLRWEADNGPRFAVAAFLSGALAVAGFVANALTFGGVSGDEKVLKQIDTHHAGVLAGRLIQAAAVAALVVALFYLYRSTRARRSEGGLSYFWPIGLLAPVLLAVAGVSGYFDAIAAANEFVSGTQNAARAKELADDLSSTFTRATGQAGGLCLALTYVLISLNAMRAGLLSRFMGILGIIGGALVVLPVLPGSVVQLFWVVALGALFLDRWPNGRGPAWSVVEPIRWPTAADLQAARQAAEPDAGEPESEQGPTGQAAPVPAPDRPQRTRASRKKKRRGGR